MFSQKSRSEIEARLRELVVAEFDRRVVEASRRLPKLCVHHVEHQLDDRKVIEDFEGPCENESYNRITEGPHLPVVQTIGLCGLNLDNPAEWNGTICNEPIDAQRCPYFDSKWDKKTLLDGFRQDFSDLDWICRNHPAVAELLWVLDLVEAPRLSWWKRLVYWFKRIRVERQAPPLDVNRLLKPAQE